MFGLSADLELARLSYWKISVEVFKLLYSSILLNITARKLDGSLRSRSECEAFRDTREASASLSCAICNRLCAVSDDGFGPFTTPSLSRTVFLHVARFSLHGHTFRFEQGSEV